MPLLPTPEARQAQAEYDRYLNQRNHDERITRDMALNEQTDVQNKAWQNCSFFHAFDGHCCSDGSKCVLHDGPSKPAPEDPSPREFLIYLATCATMLISAAVFAYGLLMIVEGREACTSIIDQERIVR